MKRYLCTIVLCMYSLLLYAQRSWQIKLSPINHDEIGRTIRADIRMVAKKDILYIGVGYLINPRNNEKYYNFTFSHKAYANKLSQRFILNLGYEHSIIFKNGHVRMFPFTEISMAETGLKMETYYVSKSTDSGNVVMYYNGIINSKALWLVNHTGIGCEIYLSDRISIIQQAGISPSMVIEKRNGRNQSVFQLGVEVPFYNVGITCKL